MDAYPPEKPPMVAQLSAEMQKKLDAYYKRKRPPEPFSVVDFGPIDKMILGPDWTLIGNDANSEDRFHGGGQINSNSYTMVGADCVLQVEFINPDGPGICLVIELDSLRQKHI